MAQPSRDSPERRHTEVAQNAVIEDGEPLPEGDAEGTRIFLIVVVMVLFMFTVAVIGLIFVARPHGIVR